MADTPNLSLPMLIPYLTVSDGAKAIDFYKRAFGAEEVMRSSAPNDTRLMNARLTLQGNTIMLADDFPEYHGGKGHTPEALGGTPVTLHLQVADADTVFNSAVEAGATVTMPLSDMFWGDRYGQVRDPFGHRWSIGATQRKLTKEEIEAGAVAAFAKADSKSVSA